MIRACWNSATGSAGAIGNRPPTKKFDEADFGQVSFELLPAQARGPRARHVVEVRHDSFCVPEFVTLLPPIRNASSVAEHGKYPAIADIATRLSSMRVCRRANDELRPVSAETTRCLGETVSRPGQTAASRTICRASTRRKAGRRPPRDVFAYVIPRGQGARARRARWN